MPIIDFALAPQAVPDHVDILVIGSGPAGMTVAAELIGSPLRVLVVESGGIEADRDVLSRNDNVGDPRIGSQPLVRVRALGGTSAVWSGRCAPLDEIDFERRDWVPGSGWPISRHSIQPYLGRAARALGLGPQEYTDALWPLLGATPPARELDTARLVPRFWHFSRGQVNPAAPTRFSTDAPAEVTVVVHATASRLESENGVVTAVHLNDTTGAHRRITVGRVVLAAGAIETPRLMLASGLGNDNTGRYLMDHPGAVIASIPPETAAATRHRFGLYWKRSTPFRLAYIHGVCLAPQLQADEKLLNAAAWLDEYPSRDDPWQAGIRLYRRLRARPEAVSAEVVEFWRAAGTPGAAVTPLPGNVVARLLSKTFPVPSALADLTSIVRHVGQIVVGARRLLRGRPPLYLVDRIDLYSLVEQVPDPESRVTLSDEIDELGTPLPQVDWRRHEQEFRTMRRLAEIVSEQFTAVGLPAPDSVPWMSDFESWKTHVLDRAHQIGTVRMGSDGSLGAVDTDCRVYGSNNLFVAGSAVFPTSGHANPTLMIVALAIRLADHLKSLAPDAAAPGDEDEVTQPEG